MVDFYSASVMVGSRKFAEVPVKFQADVKADMLALGLDENGNKIVPAIV